MRESLLQKGRQLFELAAAHVAIDVGKDVLDENLAAELLAKKADVAPDDRAQIEQDGRFVGRKARQELAESFRRENRILGRGRRGTTGPFFRLTTARAKTVEKTH